MFSVKGAELRRRYAHTMRRPSSVTASQVAIFMLALSVVTPRRGKTCLVFHRLGDSFPALLCGNAQWRTCQELQTVVLQHKL